MLLKKEDDNMNRPSDVVYGYFKVVVGNSKFQQFPKGGTGYACVRLNLPPKESNSTKYKASFSFCSPADAPKQKHELNRNFRALSRKIADNRMNTTRVKAHVEFDFKRDETTKLPQIMKFALDQCVEASKENGKAMAPQWVILSDKIEYGLY